VAARLIAYERVGRIDALARCGAHLVRLADREFNRFTIRFAIEGVARWGLAVNRGCGRCIASHATA